MNHPVYPCAAEWICENMDSTDEFNFPGPPVLHYWHHASAHFAPLSFLKSQDVLFLQTKKVPNSSTPRDFVSYMDVSKNRGIPKWMVYNGKPYLNGMILGGTSIFGNIHINPTLYAPWDWNMFTYIFPSILTYLQPRCSIVPFGASKGTTTTTHPKKTTTRPKLNSSPLKNAAWKTILSYWVSVAFQGRTAKLREGTSSSKVVQVHPDCWLLGAFSGGNLPMEKNNLQSPGLVKVIRVLLLMEGILHHLGCTKLCK